MGKKLFHALTVDFRKLSFYMTLSISFLVLLSFQNCGKVKFDAKRAQAIVPQSCGTITMNPQNGLAANTEITFTVTPPNGITISDLEWSVTKGNNPNPIYTSTTNPLVRSFDHAGEGVGDYLATAVFMKSDGNGCELARSFQILSGDVCVDPSGINGPTVGFVGEETSPFSVDYEDCYVGNVIWDMNTDGVPEYNNNITDDVTYTYNTPGTYTVTARTTNSEDNSQTIITHQIIINYANCTNGATNPPLCDVCPAGNILVGGQCVPNCTNGATNPPTCTQCPVGNVMVNGQCVNNCTNGATNPPTCSQCPTGQSLVNGQCTTLTYSWVPGTWSSCSAVACGTSGVQTRANICVSSVGVPVSNSLCTQPQPATSQPCSARACNSCTLDGVTVAHGQPRTFFSSTTVACGQTCFGQSRTCNDGQLGGDANFNRANCTAAACTFAWEIGNWSACSATACNTAGTQSRSVICRRSDGSVAADSSCTQPKPATSQACSARACNSCSLPWGGAIAHGQPVTAFQASQVACGQTCASETRTCVDGTLTGSFTQSSCSVAACPVNGSCGSSHGTTTTTAPTSGLCNSGTPSGVSGSGPWSWTCSGSNGGATVNCSAARAAPTCEWVQTAWNPGGCGSQGGGSGSTVCVGDGVTPGGPWSCNVKECNPANEGLTYQSGYSERWDGYPACDTSDYQCVCN